jgi:soluble lytic murein transglycosylase-like protein
MCARRRTTSTRNWSRSSPRGAPRPSECSLLRLTLRPHRAFPILVAAVLLGPWRLFADIPTPPVSGDLEAELARAADLLEAGQRPEGEAILLAVGKRAAAPAWDARIAFLLAQDDERRGDLEAAIARLRGAPAGAVGLEAHRREFLARVLQAAGRDEEALVAARLAFEAEGPFAMRARAGRALARRLEEKGRRRDAAEILARAATIAAGVELAAIAVDRIRLGLELKDAASVSQAARDVLLRAPTLDAAKTTPAFVRRATRAEEAGLSPADRARRGRALVSAGDARRGVPLLSRDRPALWPEGERALSLLALARGHSRLGRRRAAESALALVPRDGTLAAFEAELFAADLLAERLRQTPLRSPRAGELRLEPVRQMLLALTSPETPLAVRRPARARLIGLAVEGERFGEGLEQARALTREDPESAAGFEPLWQQAWRRYREGDFRGARRRFEALGLIYDHDVWRTRRLAYWRARCLLHEGRAADARPLLESLAAAHPPDVYALFARRLVPDFRRRPLSALGDPSTATARFRRTDELLRLRMFVEAASEARTLLPSRGRDLRLAEAEFALGRFASAAAAVKRAIPEIGTAEEGRVPDPWRRFYYPLAEGGPLASPAREFGLDLSLFRGLVRQESVFDAGARSKAGAIGLAQLMPQTAKGIARSVLRVRYRRAFLYDPGVNLRLGAAYFRGLLDRFGGKPLYALAAYNGGPTRLARLLAENPGLEDDEILESLPAYETRDYVRRVLLYAESYRELYPG